MRRHVVPPALRQGPFTTAQARDAGVCPDQLGGPAYRRLLRGVYLDAALADSPLVRAQAVRLVLPDGAVVGYETAAWLWGADVGDARSSQPQVVVARGDQMRRRGVSTRSALLEPGDVTEFLGIPVTTPVRTAFDLARRPELVEAVVGIDAMLNRGRCRLDDLAAYVTEHRGWRHVRTVDEALRHAEPLSMSPMETRQRMALVLDGLPRPRAQAPVIDGNGVVFAYIDNGYEEWQVGVDYDGEVHREQWAHDLERQERIRDCDWWHRRYTRLQIGRGAPQMCAQVRGALIRAGWRPEARRECTTSA